MVIEESSLGLRRDLGPSAWLVIEELLLGSSELAGRRVVSLSVRSLARSLGLAKDTIARALSRLQAAGLVARVIDDPAVGAGRVSVYRLTVPVTVSILDATATPAAPAAVATTARPIASVRRAALGSQLSFAIES